MNRLSTQKGFSIIELMVALLLGLFLMGGVTAMYISSKQSYRVTDNLSRLQESLRFSLEFMSRDIRMAGYMPCRFPPTFTNAITNGTSTWFLDYFNFSVRGYEGNASTPANNVAANTDAIAILKGSVYSASVGVHDTATNTISLQGAFPNGEFDRGEVAIACDPRQAAIFQVSSSNGVTGAISYGDNSNIAPGNSTTVIGNFGPDAQVTSFSPVIYYIRASTQNPNVNSLWRSSFVAAGPAAGVQTAGMGAEELLEGVENMQILYGEDTLNNDQVVDQYVTANNVTNWQNVITIRLGLLMSSGEQVAAQDDANTYNVAGTLISDSSTPAHAGDRRLRYVVNTTINLRNRVN